MKVVEIIPRPRTCLYGALVARETAVRRNARGTYTRVGRSSRRSVHWKRKMYRGSVQLLHGQDETVTAKVRAPTPEEERRLLSSSLGILSIATQAMTRTR